MPAFAIENWIEYRRGRKWRQASPFSVRRCLRRSRNCATIRMRVPVRRTMDVGRFPTLLRIHLALREDLALRTYDFSPLWRSTVGFDHPVDVLDAGLRQTADDNCPPYNIERSSEDAYRISLAVAGFGVNDISVTAEHDTLTIEGRKPKDGARILYQGIAARPFRRMFNLGHHVQVEEAGPGMACSSSTCSARCQSMKPRRIPIASVRSTEQIEQKKAA